MRKFASPALREARISYDHLAGDLGVAMLDSMIARDLIRSEGEALTLTSGGEAFVRAFGIEVAGLGGSRRPLCKSCLDWSVRRSHLAGSLGAALLGRIGELGWAKRVEGTRVINFSPRGGGKLLARRSVGDRQLVRRVRSFRL